MKNTDLIRTSGELISFEALPKDLQDKIRQYAAVDLLKDEVKDNLKAGRVNVDKYLADWLVGKPFHTARAYRRALQDFFEYARQAGIHPLAAKAEIADRFLAELRTRGLAANSIRARLAACASFFQRMRRYGYLTVNPFHGVDLPKKEFKKAVRPDQARTMPVMIASEYRAILAACTGRLARAVKVMATYGLRVGALEGLTVRTGRFTFTTKGGKSGSRALTFPLPAGKPFEGYTPRTLANHLCKITAPLLAAGKIRWQYSPHDFRHFFAHTHWRKHKDEVALKDALGHASLNTTDSYLQNIGMK